MSTAAARRAASNRTPAQTRPIENPVARFRPKELRKLFRRRHGYVLPADDNGRRAAARMLDAYALSGNEARQEALNFIQLWCPWMSEADRIETVEQTFSSPRFWSPGGLGDDLELTWDERDELKITTIRPAGNVTKADLDERRNAKAAARMREKRRQATLHPSEKASLPAIRAGIIADLLKPGERCTVRAICDELKRIKHVRFSSLKKDGPKRATALKAAVHDAIEQGVINGILKKTVETGPRGLSVAWVSRAGGFR
jgi:hypothetical protein